MHTTPEVLSLLAVGESVATSEDQAHLAQCPVCTAELEELSRVVDAARHSDPDHALSTPHPAVWQKIQREIKATPGATAPGSTPPAVGRGPRPAYVLVAAVALIVGLGGGFAVSQAFQPPAAAQATRPVHLNALPKWPGAEGEAVVKDDGQGRQVLAVSLDLPQQPTGRLEVWLSDERAEHMKSMGYMDGSSGTFPIPAGTDLAASPVVDVSVEPADDTNPAHSNDSIVRGRIVR